MSEDLNSNPPASNSSSRQRPHKVTVPRKKACQQCTTAKVRCDLKRPQCSRCGTRRTACTYAAARPTVDHAPTGARESNRVGHPINGEIVTISADVPRPSIGAGFQESATPFRQTEPFRNPGNRDPQDHISPYSTSPACDQEHNEYWTSGSLNFVNLSLVCTVDPTRIRNRWLADFIPSLTDRIKIYPPGLTSFISRVLKTYPTMLLRKGQLPPFIHPALLAGPDIPTPLANCISLVRLWDGQVRGSETIVYETIKKEMERLYHEVCIHKEPS
jgi:hypothetical protein